MNTLSSVRRGALLPLISFLSACGSGGGDRANSPPISTCDPNVEFCDSIPATASACSDNQHWPLVAHSNNRPLSVHYSTVADSDLAEDVIEILDNSWTTQIEQLGFSEPLSDNGSCGDDGRYDVFLWRGIDGAFVDGIAENPQSPHNDFTTYMAIEPSRRFLSTTLAHEFNHALQASDDWWESSAVFETSATFVEALVYPDRRDYFFTITDFQQYPEWSLFYDDNFRTWYMYGAAMYLHFLYEKYYATDPGFIARIWRMTRSAPAASRPDFIDALRKLLLNERGVQLNDAIVEFMQWRWFVAEFADGAHFVNGDAWPTPVSHTIIDASVQDSAIDLNAMIYGARYVQIQNGSDSEMLISLDLQDNNNDVNWRMTSTEGAEIAGNISIPARNDLVLVATVVPIAEISTETLDFEFRSAVLTIMRQ